MAQAAPQRGDLIWLQFSPQLGHEQAGRRPGLVLTTAAYHRMTGLAQVCPITSKRKGFYFEVALPPGLPIQGVVLADQMKNVDWRARQAEFIGAAPDAVVEATLAKLRKLLWDEP